MHQPKGKGTYIWAIRDCKGLDGSRGNHKQIALRLVEHGFSHAYVKIINGLNVPGVNFQTESETKAFCKVLQEHDIDVWGWGYVTGVSPSDEAKKAAAKVKEWHLSGFAADMEGEFDTLDKTTNALKGTAYVQALRANLPDHAIGLSSYRFPNSHPYFPWSQVLQYMDFHNPQVYEWGSSDPITQLKESYRQLTAIRKLPYHPIASAYCFGGWCPTVEQLDQFFTYSKQNFPSASYWELGRTDLYWAWLYTPIKNFSWPIVVEPPWEPEPEPEKDFLEELIMTDAKFEVLTFYKLIKPEQQSMEINVPENEFWVIYWFGVTTGYLVTNVILRASIPDTQLLTPIISTQSLGRHNWLRYSGILPLPPKSKLQTNFLGTTTENNQYVAIRFYVQKRVIS
jgi:hypothetical protein